MVVRDRWRMSVANAPSQQRHAHPARCQLETEHIGQGNQGRFRGAVQTPHRHRQLRVDRPDIHNPSATNGQGWKERLHSRQWADDVGLQMAIHLLLVNLIERSALQDGGIVDEPEQSPISHLARNRPRRRSDLFTVGDVEP
jgi:hypothetical protein